MEKIHRLSFVRLILKVWQNFITTSLIKWSQKSSHVSDKYTSTKILNREPGWEHRLETDHSSRLQGLQDVSCRWHQHSSWSSEEQRGGGGAWLREAGVEPVLQSSSSSRWWLCRFQLLHFFPQITFPTLSFLLFTSHSVCAAAPSLFFLWSSFLLSD